MAKTIFEALRDNFMYSLTKGFFENRLIERGLNETDPFTTDVAKSNAYRGAIADSIKWLIVSPNMSEGDISFSQNEKDKMLKVANSIYAEIGEEPIDAADKPIVYIES